MQAADGELEPSREAAVREHLSACWSCRTRMREIEDTIAEFVHAHQGGFEVPPAEAPRAMLRARMAELAANSRPGLRERFSNFLLTGNRLAYVGGVFFVVAVLMFANAVRQSMELATHLVPDPNLTPGATVPVSTAEVCTQEPPVEAGFIPVSVGREVFKRYGIGNPRPDDYELDYLIAPELGGADDPRNFWPQTYNPATWNAHLKDALEDRLHTLVCEKKVTLGEAQRALATNWIAAYKKYFQTQKPIASHEEFTKDHPWEE